MTRDIINTFGKHRIYHLISKFQKLFGTLIFVFFLVFPHTDFSEDVTATPSTIDINPDSGNTVKGLDISQKNRLSDVELNKKKEDGYFTFIGGPASSPDSGFGGTAVLLYYYNGKKDDELFPYTPYLHNIGLLASYQSRGYTSFAIAWDAPYFLHTPFRMYADLWFNINPVSQYFGIGESSRAPLTDPQGQVYSRMDEYDASLRSITGGETNAYYNYYYARWFDGKLMVQRDFGGGIFRVLAGYLIKHYTIEDYSNQTITVTDTTGLSTDGTMGMTLLNKDYVAGKIRGFNGGWSNGLMVGLAFDNRDLEPYPRKGMFHDIAFVYHPNWLGSDFDYSELTVGSRFYISPFKEIDLVIAARLALSYKFGDVPFFALTTMQFTDQNLNSLGGNRGYRDRRFLGSFVTLANLEIRYNFLTWKWGEQVFDLSVAPFLDMSSVFDLPQNFNFDDWKPGYGAGIRLTWNQATVIRFDFGFSSEDFGFYLMIKQLY